MNARTELSNGAWCAKAIAMLLVVTAHTDFSAVSGPVVTMVLNRLGAGAVPVYLMLSGYFFHPEKDTSLRQLLKRKADAMGLPWLFCGSVIYAYTALRGGAGLTLAAGIRFLLGKGSYLYFLTVLLILQILFYCLSRMPRAALLWGSSGISSVSVLLTAAGVLDPVVNRLGITHYLNVCNWCGFFAVGFWAQSVSPERLVCGVRRMALPAGVAWLVMLALGMAVEKGTYGYFSLLGYPMELCGSVLLLFLGICLKNSGFLHLCGRYSFSMYLLHIQVVPVVYKFFGGYPVGALLSPVVSCGVTFGAIWLAVRIAGWLGHRKMACRLLGIRP